MVSEANKTKDNEFIGDDSNGKGLLTVDLVSFGFRPNEKNIHNKPEDTSLWLSVDICKDALPSNQYWWSIPQSEEGYNLDEEEILEVEKAYTAMFSPPESVSDRLTLEYSQESKEISLTEHSLSKLWEHSIVISLYSGESRDKTADKLLGTNEIHMGRVLRCVNLFGTFTFDIPVEADGDEEATGDSENINALYKYSYTLEYAFNCDILLADYVTGSRFFEFDSLCIKSLPTQWKLEVEDDENPMEAAEDPSKNTCIYDITVYFSEMKHENIASGKLIYAVEHNQNSCSDQENNELDQEKGEWIVVFPSTIKQFVHRNGIAAIHDRVKDADLRINIEKNMGADTNPIDVWRTSTNISLEQLLEPGTTTCEAGGKVVASNMPSQEELEDIISTSTIQADKLKSGAILKDHDNFRTNEADHAATLLSASTNFHIVIRVDQPIVLRPVTPPKPLLSISDIIPPREAPTPPKKDNKEGLRREIRRTVLILIQEYEKLFINSTSENQNSLSKEDRRRKLVYHLNTEGIYHEFKEKLKVRIVRVVREVFSEAPSGGGSEEKDHQFYSQLYLMLMKETSQVLNEAFSGIDEVTAVLTGKGMDEEPASDDHLKVLKVKANESEANGNWEKCTSIYLQRIAYAEENSHQLGGPRKEVWLEYGKFCFKRLDFEKAAECLKQSLSIDQECIEALQLYGGLLCETKDYDTAEIVIKNQIKTEEKLNGNISSISHALLALYYDQCGIDKSGNMTSYELMSAKNAISTTSSRTEACIWLADYLAKNNLNKSAQWAIDLAKRYRSDKTILGKSQRLTYELIQGKVAAFNEEYTKALEIVKNCTEIDPESAKAWFFFGRIQAELNKHADAIDSLSRALKFKEQLDEFSQLQIFLQLGALYLQSSKIEESKATFLNASKEFPMCSTWLGVGISCLRLQQWDEAEKAFAEANILDNTNEEVWGYLALLSLSVVPPRHEEADFCIKQALRHDLANPGLLREIASGFTATDKLENAEALLRRSLNAQDSSITRRMLADVLSAQNFADSALQEYQVMLETSHKVNERCELLEKCARLLTTLGKTEEAKEYRKMVNQLLEEAGTKGTRVE